MEVPLSWERLLWSRRGLLPPWERYVLTDFRLVRLGRHQSDELAIQDIADVQHREAWIDRILGSSTVVVHSRNHRRAPLVLPHVRHGAQLAALLDLTSAEPTVRWDQQSVRAALKWNPRTPVAGYREAALSVLTMLLTVFVVAVSMHGKAAAVVYPSNDAIYPNGEKKDRATIVRFMETDVMPWARVALGPIKGGPDNVTCETCHGRDAQAREWQMPAVARLPQPEVTVSGMGDLQFRHGHTDAQCDLWVQRRHRQAEQGRIHARSRHARHGSPAPASCLRLHPAIRVQSHPIRVRLLSLSSGELVGCQMGV